MSAYGRWLDEAQAEVDRQLDPDRLPEIRAGAAARLGELQEQIEAINNALRVDVENLTLPIPVVPEAAVEGMHGVPLIDSRWPFVEQTKKLMASKSDRPGHSEEPGQ